ncbi:MAG: N-glycosylase/DNA lyase [archaeon]
MKIDERVRKTVNLRLRQFSAFKDKSDREWFSELCFCILTANSKASTAIKIHHELCPDGFCESSLSRVRETIRKHKHRFHNNKAKFIVEARKHLDVKPRIKKIVEEKGQKEAREWLVKNIKGIGYKEASHFLRNVGYFDLAILDRHILNLMVEDGILKEKPRSLSKKVYLEIEKKFEKLAKQHRMSCAELDLYFWSMKTGIVLR